MSQLHFQLLSLKLIAGFRHTTRAVLATLLASLETFKSPRMLVSLILTGVVIGAIAEILRSESIGHDVCPQADYLD